VRQKLQRNEPQQAGVLGFINYAHSATAELFGDAVMRDGFADHNSNGRIH
jgi:hypothetical protein